MKRKLSAAALLTAVLLLVGPLYADLAGDVRAVLGDKLLSKGEVGVEMIRLGKTPSEDQVIYQFKATAPRIPASNLKLVTTAAALETLGADFHFKTVLAMRESDLALIGDGDPTLGDAELLRKTPGWDVDTVFKTWAEMLKKRGITQVHDIYVDDSIFDEEFVHPDWPVEQEHKRYVAQVGGVNLNANCLDFYLRTGAAGQTVQFRTDPVTAYATIGNTCVTGSQNAVWLSRRAGGNEIVLRGETNVSNDEPVSVTIHDPPMYAATVLAETLAANGIKLSGQVQRDRSIRAALAGATTRPATNSSQAWLPLAIHATPLPAVLARANKDSMNLYAEALCKRIGAAASGTSGSWANGTASTAAFLQTLGVASNEFNLDDGCGLSKKNAISPNAIAKVLEHKFHDQDHDVYLNSLAVAGVDGTFEHRFKDSDLRARVFGKSGYVNGVSTLSGYLKAKDGQWYVFSILMNGLPEGTVLGAKQLQERIVKAMDIAAAAAGIAAGR